MNVVITKASRYCPEPNECISCAYQNQCNGGEKCMENADKLEARRAKSKANREKNKEKNN
jgi:hypothetical protein